jgi:hypothetical protein
VDQNQAIRIIETSHVNYFCIDEPKCYRNHKNVYARTQTVTQIDIAQRAFQKCSGYKSVANLALLDLTQDQADVVLYVAA